MFKGQNQTWAYFLGILILFGVLALVTRDFMLPIFTGRAKVVSYLPTSEKNAVTTINTNLDYYADINTNFGIIVVDLYEKLAPVNVDSFVELSIGGFYNQTLFHRYFKGVLIQGGDPYTKVQDQSNWGKGGPGYVVADEINAPIAQYSLVMANAGKDTNGSQFFIVLGNPETEAVKKLQGKFTVIGYAFNAADFNKAIESIPINEDNQNIPTPLTPIIIQSIRVYTL